jgi:hypothetical protein
MFKLTYWNSVPQDWAHKSAFIWFVLGQWHDGPNRSLALSTVRLQISLSASQGRTQVGAVGLQLPPSPQNRNLKNTFCRYYDIKSFM